MIGKRILDEALSRGHEVVAILRGGGNLSEQKGLRIEAGDIFNRASVAAAAAGSDVVISAFGPGSQPERLLDATQALIEGVREAGVRRLIAVGGAGSLEVAPGVRLIDTPDFPAAWKTIAAAHSDALEIYRKVTDLDWTSLSPAAFIEPGERTGRYRTSKDTLLTAENGESRISAEDFAIAVLDEAETPKFPRQRFGVAY